MFKQQLVHVTFNADRFREELRSQGFQIRGQNGPSILCHSREALCSLHQQISDHGNKPKSVSCHYRHNPREIIESALHRRKPGNQSVRCD